MYSSSFTHHVLIYYILCESSCANRLQAKSTKTFLQNSSPSWLLSIQFPSHYIVYTFFSRSHMHASVQSFKFFIYFFFSYITRDVKLILFKNYWPRSCLESIDRLSSHYDCTSLSSSAYYVELFKRKSRTAQYTRMQTHKHSYTHLYMHHTNLGVFHRTELIIYDVILPSLLRAGHRTPDFQSGATALDYQVTIFVFIVYS